jgi:transcriptional regulator with XRE-family HTH domain
MLGIRDSQGVGGMPRGVPRPRADEEGIRANVAGIRVKERRQALDMTQQELTAKIAYVSGGKWNPAAQEVLRLESGRRGILDIELIYLSKALECTTSWLLGEEGATAPPEMK